MKSTWSVPPPPEGAVVALPAWVVALEPPSPDPQAARTRPAPAAPPRIRKSLRVSILFAILPSYGETITPLPDPASPYRNTFLSRLAQLFDNFCLRCFTGRPDQDHRA